MKQKTNLPGNRQKKEKKRPIVTRKLVAITILGVILLSVLLICGWFGVKTFRLSKQRQAAMAAYEAKDFVTAERLLRDYVRKDQNSEPAFVALANIYREFGDTGREAQMWRKAGMLNPLNQEYRDNMLLSTLNAAEYLNLHGILARKKMLQEEFTAQELYYFVISSYRSSYPKDGDDTYKDSVKTDPEAFHKNDLGRMAEYMAISGDLSEGERKAFLDRMCKSEDPSVRYEALFSSMLRILAIAGDDESYDEEIESLLKQLVAANDYAGTPLLVDFYYSRYRFDDVIAVAETYLDRIDNFELAMLYAESCVFSGRKDKLEALEKKLLGKTGNMRQMADYCGILIAYMDDDEAKLDTAMRTFGNLISSPLSRFIRLRLAMRQDSYDEILTVTEELFAYPPFHDLHDQAMALCLNYLVRQMQKPENQSNPSRMAALAKPLEARMPGVRILTDIILSDQSKKGLTREQDVLKALAMFPDDLLLYEIAADQMLAFGKWEQLLELTGQAEENGVSSAKLDFLRMTALARSNRPDEAAEAFREIVEKTESDRQMLSQYFLFCRENRRIGDLASMADRLENAQDADTKRFAVFFRAAVLLADGDDAKTQEALDMLAAAPNDNPDFTFYAANRLSEADRLNEAEAKYLAALKDYSNPALIHVNLSEVYHAKGDRKKALDEARSAYEIGQTSRLTAFVYASRLSEAGRYEEAVEILRFPQYKVNYDEKIIGLWVECMHHVIEKSIRERKFMQAEELCNHLLIIAPDDAFGKEKREIVREILFPKKDKE